MSDKKDNISNKIENNKLFNLKYNLLAIAQIILSLTNSLLLIKLFGVSAQTDCYLLASSIVASLQLLQLMFTEQFMFFYNDIKVCDTKEAIKFYNFTLIFTIFISLIFFIVSLMLLDIIIKVFAFNLDMQRASKLKDLLLILIFINIFISINSLNEKYLNSEMRFAAPYIISLFPVLFMVIVQLWMLYTKKLNISFIAHGQVFGYFFSTLVSFIFVHHMGHKFKFIWYHAVFREFIKNSMAMRFGHNIHNFLFTPITNNILSSLQVGQASYFYLAQKIMAIVFAITVGPSAKVFLANVASSWSEKNLITIRILMKNYLKVTLPMFILLILITYLSIPVLLSYIKSNLLSYHDIEKIKFVFLSLSVWYLILVVESAFDAMIIASKKSVAFIVVNAIFVVNYFILSSILLNIFGIYSIPVSVSISQILSLVIFIIFVFKLLNDKIPNYKNGNMIKK